MGGQPPNPLGQAPFGDVEAHPHNKIIKPIMKLDMSASLPIRESEHIYLNS